MATLTKAAFKLSAILRYTLLALMLISCSDDDELNHNKFDHTHLGPIDIEKHLFEHEFAQQCIAKGTFSLTNKGVTQERLAESCMCIATYLFKDLAAKESYALLKDKKNAPLLRTKYEEAISHCS